MAKYQIQKKRFSEEIAEAIQTKISDMGLREGDRLSSHASLAKELNVSIPSLREGLQTLVTAGVLKISHGVGTIVVRPKLSDYFRILNPVLLSKPRSKEEFLTVLRLLEPYIAKGAAKKGGSFPKLTDSIERMQETRRSNDIEAFMEEDLRFHRRLAKLAGNGVIAEILNIVTRLLFSNKEVKNFIRRDMDIIIQNHQEILCYLEKGDSRGAEKAMTEHISLLGNPRRMSIIYDTFGTGSIGGSFYAVGRELCRILRSYGGIPIESEPTGGGIENVELTAEGKAILGLTQSDVAFHAFNGTGPFYHPHKEIRAVCGAHQLDLWIAVPSSSPIQSLCELKGKRIAMGALGGESGLIAKALLDSYGYGEGDYRPFYLSISNAVQGIRNGEIDVIFYLSGGPGTALAELCDEVGLRLLPIDQDHAEKIINTHPYWHSSIIKSDSCPGLKVDVPTLGVSCLLITHRDVPDDMINTITSVIMERAEEVDFEYLLGTKYGLETASKGVSIPFHPGAEKYYREKGILNEKDSGNRSQGS